MNERRKRLSVGRIALKVAILLVLFLLGYIFLIVAFGLPRWAVDALLRRVNRGDYVVEVAQAGLDPASGILLTDVRLFRKGRVGPPAVAVGSADVSLNARALLRGGLRLESVWLEDVTVYPELLGGATTSEVSRLPELDFGVGVTVENLRIGDMLFDHFSCRAGGRGSVLWAEAVRAVPARAGLGGAVEGEARYDFADSMLQLDVNSGCDLRSLQPLFRTLELRTLSRLAQWFEFTNVPPRLDFRLTEALVPGGMVRVEGSFWMRDFRYRGVDALRADGGLLLDCTKTNYTIRLDPFLLVRGEGMVRGHCVIRPRRPEETVEFDAVSMVEPEALCGMIGILTNGFFDAVQFDPPYRIAARGVVGYEDLDLTDFSGTLECGGLRHGSMLLKHGACDLRMLAHTNWIQNLRGTFCSGEMKGSVCLMLPREPDAGIVFTADADLRNADFDMFAEAVLGAEPREYSGRISGRASVTGRECEDIYASLRGEGNLNIKDGRVFMLPLFGPLSDFFSRIIPGLDFLLAQSNAKARLTIGDRAVRSEDIRVEGDVLGMQGKGSYHFDRQMDFAVELTLLKSHTFMGRVVRIPTYLFSKLFEFRLHGTPDDPQWYPVNFSRDVLDKRVSAPIPGMRGKDSAPPVPDATAVGGER